MTKKTGVCNICDKTFYVDELVSPVSDEEHSIGDWACPYCGSADYDFTDPEEW